MPWRSRGNKRPGLGTAAAVLIVMLVVGSATFGAIYFVSGLENGAASVSRAGSPGTTTLAPQANSTAAPSISTSSAASGSGISMLSASTTSTASGNGSSSCASLNSTVASFALGLLSNYDKNVGNATDPFASPFGNATVTDLLGNFTQMTISQSLKNPDNASESLPESFAYTLLGQPVINSTRYDNVNVTLSILGENASYSVLFAPNGTASSITSDQPGGNMTGSAAATLGWAMVNPFMIEMDESAMIKSLPGTPGLTVANETTLSLGPTLVKVTFYEFENLPISFCGGGGVTNVTVGVGTPPGTNVPMVLYAGETLLLPDSTPYQFSEAVTSLTVAGK